MDEKGFIIGICHVKKCVISKEMLANGKLFGAVQDDSCEFVTLLACICVDGTAFLLALIYQGTSGDLQDTWLEDYDAFKDEAYFAFSQKSWTNENLGVFWLEKVFIGTTSAKAGLHNRMLIVNGYSSYVNWCFIELYDKNVIILSIFFFHFTHCLQFLDLKIFEALAVIYSNKIDLFIQCSVGFSKIIKKNFWNFF